VDEARARLSSNASQRPEPDQRRQRRAWISRDDLVERGLVVGCLCAVGESW